MYAFFVHLIDLTAKPLAAIVLTLLPAVIAIAGAASLKARSDNRVKAWVQVISALLLTGWMVLPWHPIEPEVIGMNRSATIFAYAYVLQDWLREAWRSGLDPRWPHYTVAATLLGCLVALYAAA